VCAGERGWAVSDESPGIELFGKKITQDDVIAFLNEKASASDCPACKATTWMVVMTPGDGKYMYFPSEGGDIAKANQNWPFFGAMCVSCGLLRPHSYSPLLRWMEKRAEAPEGKDG
jgi:hypothetical protein